MGCQFSAKTKAKMNKSDSEVFLEEQIMALEDVAAIQIQAWWRGTLVRRTLLHAALRAWIIQCWWRVAYSRLLDRRRLMVLQLSTRRECAVVKLQAMVRMWRVRRRYLRAQAAVRLIQMRWRNCLTRGFMRGRYQITASGLAMEMQILIS
ncbi:IQ domain-containing protein F1-like isoform X4 [Monodelphis domestica]|uniref:IQ domain-containing protein F1-like isoform X4 n=2 Tax=Monodelphis domestica TaxID=13616 RepID=UPI00044312ED|nr:IQ domain-containing protein F1-like isoform X4 [Monodelphis domestica]